MGKKKIFKNYLYNISYQILVMILPLITTPYVARVLGANGIGAYSYTQSITYYFILFGCMGLNLYGQREIAYVQDNKEKRSKVFFELLVIRSVTNAISIFLFFFLFLGYPKYHELFLIQVLDIIASLIDISWFFQGLEDFKKVVVRNFLVKLVGVILIFMLVKEPADLNIYVMCYSITLFLGNASMWLYVPRYVSKIKLKQLEFLKHIKPAMMLFFPQIATSIYNVMDKTMIGALTGIEAEVAYYEQAQKIVKVALAFITSLGTVMLPRVSYVYAKKETDKIKEYMNQSYRFVFFLGFPLMFGVAGISKGLVPWFFGTGYDRVVPNMVIICPIILVVGMTNVIGVQYFLPTNRQKEYLISVMTGSLVNLCLNFVLIPKMQSVGAAAASIIAELSVMVCQMYLVRKEFQLLTIIMSAWNYLLSSVVMTCAILIISRILPVSILSSLIEIVVAIAVYGIMLIIMRDRIVAEYKDKALSLLLKSKR